MSRNNALAEKLESGALVGGLGVEGKELHDRVGTRKLDENRTLRDV